MAKWAELNEKILAFPVWANLKTGQFFLLIIWHLKIFNISVFVILVKSVGTILASKIVFKKI